MTRNVLDCARILVLGLLAFILGGLSIDWLGTSWWSRVLAALTALSVMWYAIDAEIPDDPEVPDAEA